MYCSYTKVTGYITMRKSYDWISAIVSLPFIKIHLILLQRVKAYVQEGANVR